jgi:hypothetical protein
MRSASTAIQVAGLMPVMVVLVGVAGVGCVTENNLTGGDLGKIAVTAGDFDDVQSPFDRNDVATDRFDGIIAVATWDEDYESAAQAFRVEGLFPDINALTAYKTVIVGSGTRGMGRTVYNGVAPDDAFVADEAVRENVRTFVRKGGTLVVTDWAYDLVEATWPDEIEFLGDDGIYDAAQAGDLATVVAPIGNEDLKRAIGMEEMVVDLNFSNWAVIDSVDGADAITWMTADTSYRLPDGEGNQAHPGTPILVTLYPEGTGAGKVVVCSFHFDAQTDAVIDELVETVVGKYKNKADVTVEPIR